MTTVSIPMKLNEALTKAAMKPRKWPFGPVMPDQWNDAPGSASDGYAPNERPALLTVVVGPGARVVPVTEADPLVVRRTTESDDERSEDQPEEASNLDDGRNDLGFSIAVRGEVSAGPQERDWYRRTIGWA